MMHGVKVTETFLNILPLIEYILLLDFVLLLRFSVTGHVTLVVLPFRSLHELKTRTVLRFSDTGHVTLVVITNLEISRSAQP
jgi:hypothetical protein